MYTVQLLIVYRPFIHLDMHSVFHCKAYFFKEKNLYLITLRVKNYQRFDRVL